MDASNPNTVVSYWRWFSTTFGSNPFQDIFVVEVKDLSHLNRVVKAVKKIKGVLEVERREHFEEEDLGG